MKLNDTTSQVMVCQAHLLNPGGALEKITCVPNSPLKLENL